MMEDNKYEMDGNESRVEEAMMAYGDSTYHLSAREELLLACSERDYAMGKVFSQEEIDRLAEGWLR